MLFGVGLSEGEDGWENVVETGAHYVLMAQNSHNVLSENNVGRGKEGGRGGRGRSVGCYIRVGHLSHRGVGGARVYSVPSSKPRPDTTEAGLRFKGRGRKGDRRSERFGPTGCLCLLGRLQPRSHIGRKLLLQSFRFHPVGWSWDRK